MDRTNNRHLNQLQVNQTSREVEALFRPLTKAQIRDMAQAYHALYGGTMRGDLINIPAWGGDLEAITTYTRGCDNLRPQDLTKLCMLGAARHDQAMFNSAFFAADKNLRAQMRGGLLSEEGTLEVGNSIYTISQQGDLYRLTDDARTFHELFPSNACQIKQGDYGTCYLDSSLLGISRAQFGKFFLARLIKPSGPDQWQVTLPLHGQFKVARSDIDTNFWQVGDVDSDLGIRLLEAAYGKYRIQSGMKPRHSFFGDLGFYMSRMKLGGGRDPLFAAGTGGDPGQTMQDLVGQNISYAYGSKESFFSKLNSWAGREQHMAIEAASKTSSQYKGNTYLDWKSFDHTPDRAHQVYFNHAYSVLHIDPAHKRLLLANPWDSSKPFWESYENTYRYFYELESIELDPAAVETKVQR